MQSKPKKRGLSAQLSLTILTVLLLVIGLTGILANFVISRQFASYIQDQEKARSENIVSDLSGQWDVITKTWNQEYIHAVGMYSLYDGYILKLYDNEGKVIWDAENHDMALCSQVMRDISTRMNKAKTFGDFTTHHYDLVYNGSRVGYVSIKSYGPYFFSESDFHFIRALNIVVLLISLVAFAVSIVTGLLLARRIVSPISKASKAAGRIAGGEYGIVIESETDTRELYELINAVNRLSSALYDQERSRRQLTSDIAHELRTPLTSLGTHLEAMTSGIWEPTEERLKSCHEEVERLGSIVKDLELLEKSESSNRQLSLESVDLWELMESIVPSWEAQAKKQGIKIQASGSPAIVCADRERMAQVVTNLLSNAVKYTPPNDGTGMVEIFVYSQGDHAFIKVRDNGIGIEEDELDLIFDRFYRTDKSRNRKTGGAGIGLAIAKSIVTAHGGTIKAEREEAKGSCFTVEIPQR